MSINALSSLTPQILNAQGTHALGTALPMLPQDGSNPALSAIQQFSQLMLEKPHDEDDKDADEASL